MMSDCFISCGVAGDNVTEPRINKVERRLVCARYLHANSGQLTVQCIEEIKCRGPWITLQIPYLGDRKQSQTSTLSLCVAGGYDIGSAEW
jgi:hypothetical protein